MLHAGSRRGPVRAALAMCVGSSALGSGALNERSVETAHSFTGRMCAASRLEETRRPDSLFSDPLAYTLAGKEGRAQPMGGWIMVPRTRFGDDFLRDHYTRGARQLVLLGAGFDARAFRMSGLPELRVYEVDQKTTFEVKEPLLTGESLAVASRAAVATEFTRPGEWAAALLASGFDPAVPTVWLAEGLLMYLSAADAADLMKQVGQLSARGSAVFHDAVSAEYLNARVSVAGAPFIGASDEYVNMWRSIGGFGSGYAHDFRAIKVDRARRRIDVDRRWPEATAARCAGQQVVLFVEVEME